MKIFGIEFNKQPEKPKVEVVQDITPEINVPIKADKPISQVPTIISPALNFLSSRQMGRGQFLVSEYDLAEMGRVEDTESYVRQAFDKKVALMFKEGWDLIGANPSTLKYVRIRLSQIARASETPTIKLLRDIGSSLIRKSNAFIIKVRDIDASGGAVRALPGSNKEVNPVAGYFVAPAETMEINFANNKIVKWRQRTPEGLYKEYNPTEIIHFYYDRKDGFIFGTPQLTPVLDDIRALRKIEENIELLVYQHIFPLFQFKVGTEKAPASVDENGNREVDVIRHEIQNMPSEGGIVTTERHEILAIGVEGKALRAEGYLEHFKKRVIAGLGISAVDLGDGDTTNRATSDNMSRNLIDSVKDFQQVIEYFFNEFVIAELLLESTFGDEALDEENRVWLKFKEIDISAQIKKEAHMADQFAKNLVSWDEARLRIGWEPIPTPSPDDQETMDPTQLQSKYPQWFKTFWKLFDEPKVLIQATKTPNTPAGHAAADNPSTSLLPAHNEAANQAANEQAVSLEKIKGDAKVAAAKATAKARPKPKVKDSFVTNRFDEVTKDVINHIQSRNKVDHDWLAQIIRVSMSNLVDYLMAHEMTAFRSGYSTYGDISSDRFLVSAKTARIDLKGRAERYINKLTNDTISSLKRNVPTDGENGINLAKSVFDTIRYRTNFIEDVEIRKAKELGKALGMRDSGQRIVFIHHSKDACHKCTSDSGPLDTHTMASDSLPPFHANCDCSVDHLEDVKIHDGFIPVNMDDETMKAMKARGVYADCPKCGKVALLVKDTPDLYKCRACGHAFRQAKKEAK